MSRPRQSPSGQYQPQGVGASMHIRNAGAAQAVPNATPNTVVGFDTLALGNADGVLVADLANNRIQVVADIRALVVWGGTWAAPGVAAATDSQLQLFEVTGAPVALGPEWSVAQGALAGKDGIGISGSMAQLIQLVAGNLIQVHADQTSGGALNLSAAFLQIVQV